MDFGSSFSYVFKDPDWFKKIAIMGLITLIPILGQLVLLGWMAEIIRRVARGNLQPLLPDLDFGTQLRDGFKFFVVSLVYSIPLFIIYIPFMIIIAVLGGNGMESTDTVALIISISSICFSIIAIIYGLLLAMVLPAAYSRTAVLGKISDGLKFSEVFKMVKNNIGVYFMVLLGTIAASFVASIGSIGCGIGILLTIPYSQAMLGHLVGQAYTRSTGGSVVIPTPPSYNEPIPPAI